MPAIAPATPFAVIGDLHGRIDLLTHAVTAAAGLPLICVGDYVDRGPDSAAVLRVLKGRPDIVCVKGNHEAMMLAFLAHPLKEGPFWLRHGGIETLHSFGIPDPSESGDAGDLERAAGALHEALGVPLIDWLRQMPPLWSSGNVAVVHAGADPRRPLTDQPDSALIWGHAAFERRRRSDGIWVIHGHTIVDGPRITDGRISIDTGAWATGRLTLARVWPGEVTFETVT